MPEEKNGVDVRIASASEFRPQKNNANIHTPRGMGMLGESLNDNGYVTPMTAAVNGEIIDGSARIEVTPERLGEEIIVIKHDGKRAIVAVRTDIPDADSELAKRISVAANRVGEVNLDWDRAILESLNIDLSKMFMPWELEKLALTEDGVNAAEAWRGMPEFNQEDKESWKEIKVHFRNEEDLRLFAETINQPITLSTRSIWFPEVEPDKTAGVIEFKSESKKSCLHRVEGPLGISTDKPLLGDVRGAVPHRGGRARIL